jgi:hypothetical protein
MSDDFAYIVECSPRGRADRRVTYDEQPDGTFERTEWVRDHADEWRDVGSEVVESVSVTTPE